MREGLVIVLFVAQAVFVHWAASGEQPPPVPNLARFPTSVGSWRAFREDPVEDDVRKELGADGIVSRDYVNASGTTAANLFVAWFQTQSYGNRQPHSPQVCLPGSGWVPERTDLVAFETPGGPVTANRYVVRNGAQQAVVLYWYQSPRRTVAGEWAAKLWTISDAIRDRRTDTSLVRVVTWVSPTASVDAASSSAIAFGQDLFPLLRQELPR